jgi:prevent-host-death family protein
MPDGTFNLYEAKTRLSALVDRAAAGEEIVIAKNGRPLVRLVPIAPAPARVARQLGGGGSIVRSDAFDWFDSDYDPNDPADPLNQR